MPAEDAINERPPQPRYDAGNRRLWVNSTESNQEQNGIIGGQIWGACRAMTIFRSPPQRVSRRFSPPFIFRLLQQYRP
jgi:hypothetical protein